MIAIPDRFLDILTEKKALAHLATLMPDGSPHVTPVWFEFANGTANGTATGTANGTIRVNTVRGWVKERNLRRDPRAALSIADPDDACRSVQIRGRVTRFIEDGAAAHNNALAKKYMGLDVYPHDRPGDIHVIVEIEPLEVSCLG